MKIMHKDYKGWTQATVSYQQQDGVTGMYIPKVKTDLVLKWRNRRNSLMKEIQGLKAELLSIPRTKQGRVYKREQAKYDSLKSEIEQLKTEMHRVDAKYWKQRKRENKMSYEPVFKMLFNLWNSYDQLDKRGA